MVRRQLGGDLLHLWLSGCDRPLLVDAKAKVSPPVRAHRLQEAFRQAYGRG